MSGLVYPANLPGLTYGSTRSPVFNTDVQAALSAKESRIARQLYPVIEFELQYELLRDYTTPSDLKALVGLFMACAGKYDTFLYNDPAFNTVANMQFGVTDGSTLTYQTTATYQNAGGPGGAEIVQNFNGTPFYSINRYGTLIEYPTSNVRANLCLFSADFTNAVWAKNNVTVTIGLVAPDGSPTVSVVRDASNANVQHLVTQTFSGTSAPSGVFTYSVFAQATAETGFLFVQLTDSTNEVQAVFNLSTGVVVSTAVVGGTGFASVSGTISAVDGAWYRLSVSFSRSASAGNIAAVLSLSNSSSSITYAGTSGAVCGVLWGSQFEAPGAQPPLIGGLWPTMYIPTTSAQVSQQDIVSVGATGIVTLTSANFGAIAGIKLLWTGSFFYRVRFDDDSMTATQFLKNFWENKKVKFRQVKL
jgi:hypothetical protein